MLTHTHKLKGHGKTIKSGNKKINQIERVNVENWTFQSVKPVTIYLFLKSFKLIFSHDYQRIRIIPQKGFMQISSKSLVCRRHISHRRSIENKKKGKTSCGAQFRVNGKQKVLVENSE